MPSNALDLDAIEALANAATSGPWARALSAMTFRGEQYEGISADGVMLFRINPSFGQPAPTAEFIAAARTLVPALVARVRELEADAKRLESERDALRSFVNAEREKMLARFRAGCLVCGAMAWKVTANGNMRCGQCANIFDAPIVTTSAIDAERAE